MATHEVTQLSILTFKPPPPTTQAPTNGATNGYHHNHNHHHHDHHRQHNPSSPPSAFYDVCAQLQAVPGVAAVYLGAQLEDPQSWVWAVRWATGAALDAFVASPTYTRWAAGLRAVTDSVASSCAFLHGSASAALASPCTEVFTAFAADPDFLDHRMRPFSKCFDPETMPGFRAAAFGQWRPVVYENAPLPVGNTVAMILGWDSKEAHLAQRGEGKSMYSLPFFLFAIVFVVACASLESPLTPPSH